MSQAIVRYQAALKQIAEGDSNAQEIAREALKSHRKNQPRTTLADINARGLQRNLDLLRRYIAAGYPGYAEFARQLGKPTHYVRRHFRSLGWQVYYNRLSIDDPHMRAVAEAIHEAFYYGGRVKSILAARANQENDNARASETA
jgi:hypothetical protein